MDIAFTEMTIFCLIFFMLELILASIGNPDYLFGFFFWLDLVFSLSLITDIEPIMDAFAGMGSNEEDETLSGGNTSDTGSLVRASRGARIGTKAGRMTRVIRLIRLIRIVKLYKSANQAIAKKEAQ